ncbi:MAG TPA: hypothetical protein VMW27_21325 [Thermoanaerobaculia bacterium]|nr:hypothetical protein [Thermoanaerobaculia bacterium]
MSGDKDLARELARRLATPEGLRTARLLQMSDLLAPPAPEPPTPASRGPEPISIWQPRRIDGELVFVRPEPSPLGDHYAAVRELRPKKSELPLRVCFFGESVAAGYLYAPHLTPARVLEAQLREIGGADNFEVIDLARTNETLSGLIATVRSALQLNPDVLVLFVGNNWNLLETPEVSPYVPSVRARQRYALALREGGTEGPVQLAADQLRRAAEEALDFIAQIARLVQIPVVVVVPEVNLADWETRQPVLAGDGTARWYELHEQAQSLLRNEDWSRLAETAEAMREIDRGACSTTWRLLARARMGLGDLDGARQACLAEIDASPYPTLGFLSAPQATTAARELLREGARRHGFFLVDLPRIFPPLPDRRLFLDYCHLTSEGIHLAMAAVAAEVLNLSGMLDEDVSWQGLLSRLPAPTISPEVEATARLGAAIHNAHRLLPVGPKAPILEYWIEAALDASPGIEQAMRDLLEARCAPCPAVLTAAQQRNLASPYRLTLQAGWRWDHLDADLIAALCAVLGNPIRDQVASWLLEHHGIREDGTELIEPLYFWEPLERFYPEVMSFEDLAQRATFRSPWPESSFCLVCDGTRDVEIELTARGTSVAVIVNDQKVGDIKLTEKWTRSRLRVDSAHLRPGLNRLTLRWPTLPLVENVIERLELGLVADLHPVFGEVFSLIARCDQSH